MTTEIETEITFGRERHRLVHQRHGELKARRLNPDLARLAEEILERDNLCMGEAEIATYLAEPLESGRRGHTVKSVVADAASRRAARASQTAEESGDDDLSAHGDASDAHKEAARKHRAAAAYHDDCAAFHSEKANPKKIGADQTPGEPIDCARSLPHLLGNDASVPDVIQYMPGGTHTITPSRAGKPVTVTVLVDETTAARLEQQRQILEASGNKPFFSVQHNTQVAAFWPSRFFWDTRPDVTGKMVEGVWAEGEWTAAGREAVAGKNFRTFSPTFFVNGVSTDPDKPAEVVCNENAKLNMGALENDPAFTTISPLWKNPQPQA